MKHLYTKMKLFHFTDKLDSLPRDVDLITPPVHVRVKPTNVCNHNCAYCAYRAKNLQLGQGMDVRDSIPRDKMAEIVDDFIEMGVKAVTFSGGGEPLVYPHLAETVRRLAASGIRFATLTNGARLKGELAELFSGAGTWVRVSIDGWDEESYAHYRGVGNGEFAKVLGNMEGFRKLGGPCFLGVSLIVDERNHDHVRELLVRLKNVGASSVKVSPCIVSNVGDDNNAYHKPFFSVVKDQIVQAKAELQDDDFEVYDSYHELENKFDKEYDWCPYLQILPVIGADMNVYPCQDKAYNLEEGLIGSIRDARFKDFWMRDKGKFFKIDPRRHCRHHCVANDKNKLALEYLDVNPEHKFFV